LRWGRLRTSSTVVVGLAVLLPSVYIYLTGNPYDPVLIIYSVAVVVAGLLLGIWGSTSVAVILSVIYAGLIWQAHQTAEQPLQPLSWLVVTGAAGLIVLNVWLYTRETGRLVQRLRQQTQGLQAADQEKGRLVDDLQALTAQQQELLDLVSELAAPIIPVQEGVIILPLVGHVDEERAGHMLRTLLDGIAAHRARVAVVDLTGVPVVDSLLARSLVQMSQGARLLGATCVLSGLRAEVAHTLTRLDVPLDMLITSVDLQAGIEYALAQMGLGVASLVSET